MAYRVFNIPAVAGSGDEAAELNAFLRGHPDARCCLVRGQGMDLETFFTTPAADFLG